MSWTIQGRQLSLTNQPFPFYGPSSSGSEEKARDSGALMCLWGWGGIRRVQRPCGTPLPSPDTRIFLTLQGPGSAGTLLDARVQQVPSLALLKQMFSDGERRCYKKDLHPFLPCGDTKAEGDTHPITFRPWLCKEGKTAWHRDLGSES